MTVNKYLLSRNEKMWKIISFGHRCRNELHASSGAGIDEKLLCSFMGFVGGSLSTRKLIPRFIMRLKPKSSQKTPIRHPNDALQKVKIVMNELDHNIGTFRGKISQRPNTPGWKAPVWCFNGPGSLNASGISKQEYSHYYCQLKIIIYLQVSW